MLAGAGLGDSGTRIMAKYGGRFHLGTLIINVTGSSLIGVLNNGSAPELQSGIESYRYSLITPQFPKRDFRLDDPGACGVAAPTEILSHFTG